MKAILGLFLFVSGVSIAQTNLNGLVKDVEGQPIFAANVYLKSSPQTGTTTDFNGTFRLKIKNAKDTVIVSFIIY